MRRNSVKNGQWFQPEMMLEGINGRLRQWGWTEEGSWLSTMALGFLIGSEGPAAAELHFCFQSVSEPQAAQQRSFTFIFSFSLLSFQWANLLCIGGELRPVCHLLPYSPRDPVVWPISRMCSSFTRLFKSRVECQGGFWEGYELLHIHRWLLSWVRHHKVTWEAKTHLEVNR